MAYSFKQLLQSPIADSLTFYILQNSQQLPQTRNLGQSLCILGKSRNI